MRLASVATCIALSVMISGCTIRYSQALTGRIPSTQGSEVRSSDAGFEFFNIAFSEPTPAHELIISLLGACSELNRVEVDYRSLSFLIIAFPRVTVTGVCVR